MIELAPFPSLSLSAQARPKKIMINVDMRINHPHPQNEDVGQLPPYPSFQGNQQPPHFVKGDLLNYTSHRHRQI
jgi:hypothetical protein